MITINGKQFAATDSEFTESLFRPGGTCAGFYKPRKRRVDLLNMRRELIGCINEHGLLCAATLYDDGRYRYSFATIREIGEYASYAQERTECAAILAELCPASRAA